MKGNCRFDKMSLVGPQYKTWSMSKYKLQKMYDPPESVLTYIFFVNHAKYLC